MPNLRWLCRWGPAIGGAAAIWILSTRPFSVSSTARFILPALEWLFPAASHSTLLLFHRLIRKFAHIFVYFVFSLFVLRGIRDDRPGWRLSWGLAAMAIAGALGLLDEFHQVFVPGRSPSARDVMLDGTGAAMAQAFAWWGTHRSRSVGQGL